MYDPRKFVYIRFMSQVLNFIITVEVFTFVRLHRGQQHVENERSVQCTGSMTESFNFRNTSAEVTEVMTEFHYTKGAEVPDKQRGLS